MKSQVGNREVSGATAAASVVLVASSEGLCMVNRITDLQVKIKSGF